MNAVGMPSQIEIIQKETKESQSKEQSENLTKLLQKYGGKKHMTVPADVKQGIQAGDVDVQPSKPSHGLIGLPTKFEEDVYLGTHTSVWGSYFDRASRKWGFKCC